MCQRFLLLNQISIENCEEKNKCKFKTARIKDVRVSFKIQTCIHEFLCIEGASTSAIVMPIVSAKHPSITSIQNSFHIALNG